MEYKDITVRAYVVGECETKSITPSSGPHAGEETSVLNFRVVEPKYKKQSDGTRKRIDGIFYSVRYFGASAETVGALIKDGMCLEIVGSFYEREYETSEGEKRKDSVINVNKLLLPLNQVGLKEIIFEKRESKKSK